MNDDLSSSDVNKLGKEKSLNDYGYEIDPNSMYGWKNYYFIQSLPIRYENLLKESSFRELNRKLEYSIRKTGDEMNRETNVQADMTDYKTHLSNIHFKTLGNKVIELCGDGMRNKHKFVICDMWGAIYRKGDWTKRHQHWPYTWSFTYYVKVSEKTSPLVFANAVHPHTQKTQPMPIHPQKGDLFIWPSFLYHEVPKQEVDEERIMIAGNLLMDHIATEKMNYTEWKNFFTYQLIDKKET